MTIKCVKGSSKLGLHKGITYRVLDLTHVDKQIKLTVMLPQLGRKSFYVPMPHKNKVGRGEEFNINNGGDTTKKARVILNNA